MAKRVPVTSLAFSLLARINYFPIRKMVGQAFLPVAAAQVGPTFLSVLAQHETDQNVCPTFAHPKGLLL
jgi:hypothetical protein